MTTTKHYLICGYGGIGSALVHELVRQGQTVTLVSRQALDVESVSCYQYDLTDPTIVDVLAADWVEQQFDVIINTIGMLHQGLEQKPEKNLQQFTTKKLFNSIESNVLSTVHLSQIIDKLMAKQAKVKFVAFSARLASMNDNYLGGWYSYRMSKAMLNMFLKNLSIEWKRKFPSVIVVGYHPGTVNTTLSEPFQANLPAGQLFSPLHAAKLCLTVIDKLTIKESGSVFDWRGGPIDF